ncbi:MAG: hypothetical protein RL318_1777 [Fibrobacterota bacterium]
MDFPKLIQDYGYWAVLIGTFLEGETILILAGVAAQAGHLELTLVILSAFVGSSCGDQLYYFIGRHQGTALLRRFPRWQRTAAKVARQIQRHQNLIILSFRFFYGVRNVTPFMLGISRIPISRFLPLNLIGAAVWASAFASIGYVLGHAHERILGKGYNWVLLLALVVAGTAWFGWTRWRSRKTTPDEIDPIAEIESSVYPIVPRKRDIP